MKDLKHTPGPWKYNVSKDNDIRVTLPTNQHIHVGFIYSDECGLPSCCRVTEHANAKLIAAAPDMLEALEFIIKEFPYVNGITKAKEAVAKAKTV